MSPPVPAAVASGVPHGAEEEPCCCKGADQKVAAAVAAGAPQSAEEEEEPGCCQGEEAAEALAREATRLEQAAQLAAERNESSPLYHALLNHRPVATPCGCVRVDLPRPAALSNLHGRLRTRSPADGLFDPDILRSPEARDELVAEVAGPPPPAAEGGGEEAARGRRTLQMWAFLAHLVPQEELFPPESSDEEREEELRQEAQSSTPAAASRDDGSSASLRGAWECGAWTGTLLWDAAIHATAYILGDAEWAAAISRSECVLELGAGLGLPALACATILGARRVVATDRAPQVIDLLRENAARNEGGEGFSVETLDWSADAARELPQRLGVPRIDVAIACDCILAHLFGASEALAEFLGALAEANPGLRVLLASEIRPGCGVGAFVARAAAEAFDVRRVQVVGLVHLYELRKRGACQGGG